MIRLSIAALALGLATPAVAGTTTYAQRGSYVSASWSSYGGCESQYVSASAFENTTRSDGAPTSATTTYVYVGSYNYCTGSFSYYTGSLDDATISIQGSSATLSGSGQLYDYYTGASMAVTVSATADDSAGTYQGISMNQSSTPVQHWVYRYVGSSSFGAATLTVNGTTYSSVTGGSFGTSNTGTLTITE